MTEQQRYQIRVDWGIAGAHAIADDADVVVWVDALGADEDAASAAARAAADAVPADAAVLTATLRTARAAAEWVADRQAALGRRLTIAVVAAGAARSADDGADAASDAASPRFAMEDQLAAGAVIDRLGRRGIDATSPEAAVAQAAFRGLERAVGHLMTASVSALEAGTTPDAAERRIDDALTAADATVIRG